MGLVLVGCASFNDQQLPRVCGVGGHKANSSAHLSVWIAGGHPDSKPQTSQLTDGLIKEVAESAVIKSQIFSEVRVVESSKASSDYLVTIRIYNHGNRAAAAVSGFLSGFSFGIIPGMAQDSYLVSTEVRNRRGVLLSKSSNEDSITTWIGLWFIPVMSNTPEKAIRETLENQILTGLKKWQEDGKSA